MEYWKGQSHVAWNHHPLQHCSRCASLCSSGSIISAGGVGGRQISPKGNPNAKEGSWSSLPCRAQQMSLLAGSKQHTMLPPATQLPSCHHFPATTTASPSEGRSIYWLPASALPKPGECGSILNHFRWMLHSFVHPLLISCVLLFINPPPLQFSSCHQQGEAIFSQVHTK